MAIRVSKIENYMRRRKLTLFLLGGLLAIFMGSKDVNYFGLKEDSGKQILDKIERQILDVEKVTLNANQEKEVIKLIKKNPNKYNDFQKALLSKKSGKEILNEIEINNIDPKTVIVNAQQLKEITSIITSNPISYSEKQHYFVREKTAEEILYLVGLGMKSPKLITLTPQQHQEIKLLITLNPSLYNEAQKALISEIKK